MHLTQVKTAAAHAAIMDAVDVWRLLRERAAAKGLAVPGMVPGSPGMEQGTPQRFARMRSHFDEQAVLELTALAALQNLSSKFNAAFAIHAQGFCERSGAQLIQINRPGAAARNMRSVSKSHYLR
jgi:hypothetical protein